MPASFLVGDGGNRRRREPHCPRAPEYRSDRQDAEIATVETGRDRRVHDEDLAGQDVPAALPDRQRTAEMVAGEGRAKRRAIDRNGGADPAHDLSRQRRDRLEQRHAKRQIAAPRQHRGDVGGRPDRDQFPDMQHAR
jgi:hypothetical protein